MIRTRINLSAPSYSAALTHSIAVSASVLAQSEPDRAILEVLA
jgi:hypothetical protein